MNLQSIINIDVDFYNKKYILINAKQLDRNSRFISVTCYNQGELYSLNNGEHAVYVRYRKADNYGVFNNCDINNKGKIIVKLTEQMLAADGICYADLVIVNKGEAEVNPNTGEINELIANASVLSTMTFCIDVSEVPVSNSDIESTHEFILLNDTLEKYWANFEDVMKTSKSWAVGDTGIRDDENTNNSKYWSTQSQNSASAANTSALNAANSEELAEGHMHDALSYKNDAYTYMTNANTYMNNAAVSETNAKDSEANAATSEANAASSEINAANSEANALSYKEIVENINDSIISSINTLASSGTVGSFVFMGTITFEELMLLSDDEKAIGFVYCITNDFTTDDTFVNGDGLSYTAGTNVQYTVGGWNCLGGSSSPTATVDEVKDYLGI